MLKAILISVALLLVGCASKVNIECPNCSIQSVDGNISYECTECVVEASSHDGNLFTLPRRGE